MREIPANNIFSIKIGNKLGIILFLTGEPSVENWSCAQGLDYNIIIIKQNTGKIYFNPVCTKGFQPFVPSHQTFRKRVPYL